MKNVLVVGLLSALGASAAENVWTDATSDNVVWANSAAGWQGGQVPDWSTTDKASDTTSLASEPAFLQSILGQKLSGSSSAPKYLYQNAISGDVRHEFRLSGLFNWLKISDLADFDGVLGNVRATGATRDSYGSGSSSGVDLLATPTHTPVINTLDVSGRFHLMNKTTANSAAEVKEAFGYGVFDVDTGDVSREIRIGAVQSGNDMQVTVAAASTLAVSGLDEVTEGVHGNPLIHLDASKEDTIEHSSEDSGKGVHYWYDVRGKSGHPYASGTQGNARPWTTTDPATGLGLVDFGYCGGGQGVNDSASLGHVGYLRLIQADKSDSQSSNYLSANIKEAFWVYRDNSASNQTCCVVGNSTGTNVFARPWNANTFGKQTLFRNCRSTVPTTTGEIRVDGKRVRYDCQIDTWYRLRVVNVALNGEGNVASIGMTTQARNDAPGATLDTWWGGFRLAEMILYTNRLTAAERAGVNAYLAKKWKTMGTENDFDLGRVVLGKNAQLKVPSGTVRVEELAADKTQATMVKKGAGDLVLDRYTGPAKVSVEAGGLRFADHVAEIDDSAPAPEMLFRFDADALGSLVLSNDAAAVAAGAVKTNFVTRWNSSATNVASTVIYALPGVADQWNSGVLTQYYSKAPFIDPNVTANGHRVISFGDFIAMGGTTAKWLDVTNTAFMSIKRAEANNARMGGNWTREVFVVMKRLNDKTLVFGTQNYDLLGQNGDLGLKDYSPAVSQGAICTLDGETIDWYSTKVPTGDFYVVGMRFSDPITVDQLSGDRGNYSHGGYLLAEEIAYTRELSPSERRNTEAYLLKKWKNRAHPLAVRQTTLTSITVADGAKNEVSSDTELTVAGYATESADPLVKSGSGSVKIGALDTGVKAVEVEDGSLEAGIAPLAATAIFHVDASDTSTLVFSNDAEVAGRQYVLSWKDPVTGKSATPTYANDIKKYAKDRPWSEFAAYPRYESYEVGGRTMPIINFGGYSKCDDKNATWSQWSAAMTFPAVTFREAHTVFADVQKGDSGAAANSRQMLIGNSDTYKYSRGGQLVSEANQWMTAEYLAPAYNGYLAIDGDQKTAKYQVTDWNVHVFTTAPTEALVSDRFAADRTTGRGGQKLCEAFFFDRVLTADERKMLQDYLRAKWQAAGTEPTVAYDSLTLNGGASLALTGDYVKTAADAVSVADGATTLTAADFTATGSLTFDFTGAENPRLDVQGKFTLDESGTVRVTFPDTFKPDAGRIPLVTATSFDGAENLDGWTLTVEGCRAVCSRRFGLTVIGSTLYLTVERQGVLLIVR